MDLGVLCGIGISSAVFLGVYAVIFLSSRRRRHTIGDVLTGEGERDDSRGPG